MNNNGDDPNDADEQSGPEPSSNGSPSEAKEHHDSLIQSLGLGYEPELGELSDDATNELTEQDGHERDDRVQLDPQLLQHEAEVDASLQHALNDLEDILQHREGRPAAKARPAAADDTAPTQDNSNQYVIPLLDEVVIPGNELATPPLIPMDALEASLPDAIDIDSEPAVRRRLAERIASEIDVITQDCIESALEAAREDILAQVRNHMDIILPEIVDDLVNVRQRDKPVAGPGSDGNDID